MHVHSFVFPGKYVKLWCAVLALLVCVFPAVSLAQRSGSDGATPISTIFPHSDDTRWWISGQLNVILQAHPDFHAEYTGTNSLPPEGESKTSYVGTLYLGYRLTQSTEALVDIESAGGRGVGEALGLAGFTNLDVVRNPTLGKTPYLARAQVYQTIRLSAKDVQVERSPLGLATRVPERRLELRAGKMSTVDFFDLNGPGSDSHLQFLNWTVDNNGAYDYAADTRGYTWGMVAELQSANWAFRFGEMLMPKVANGMDLDWNLGRAGAENYELEFRPTLLKDRKSAVRLLAYRNRANMGDYQQSVARYREGLDPRPIIENTRRQGTVKYGFGLNAEQELPGGVRIFGRLGWNEGQHESFAYTEVNSTALVGGDVDGGTWHRKLDKVGVAFVTNGISAAHQEYLRLGGLGFLLGDGNLNYRREQIIESYYNLHAWRGVFFSANLQYIWNPGYNHDRGPVLMPGVRMHIDF